MDHPSIYETIRLAMKLHDGQRDKAGAPYIAHPLTVMRMVPERAWHVAVLHDVLEDCLITPEALSDMGYDEEEVIALKLLSRMPEEKYADYIAKISESNNELAIAVKIADLYDNLDVRRQYLNLELTARYRGALRMLKTEDSLRMLGSEEA